MPGSYGRWTRSHIIHKDQNDANVHTILTPNSLNGETTTGEESEKSISSTYKDIYLSFIFNNEKIRESEVKEQGSS